jgi:hypothetical protein
MSLAAFNTGGNHIALHVQCSDGTGFAIAPAAAATPEAIANALFAVDNNNTNGAITFATGTGKATVATQAGIGKYAVIAGVGDSIGQNGKYHTIQVYASEGGAAAAAVGPKAKKEEPATAVRSNVGTVVAFVDLSAVGDTVELRLGVETNADSVTIHDAFMTLVKIGQ